MNIETFKERTISNNRGQMIVVVLAILFGFMIMMFATTYYLQQESKWTIKEKKSTTAFHLAEAGLDQAIWKLNESNTGWTDAARGLMPSLYDGTTSFYEEDKGYYKIKISSEKVGGETRIIIQSVGTDEKKNEVRGLKAIYTRQYVDSAIKSVTGATFGGSADVHWGPIMNTRGDIVVDKDFPRKYAGTGYIVDGRDPDDSIYGVNIGPENGIHTDNQPLDADYKDWSSNGVRDIADVDIKLSEYIGRATSYITPTDAPDRNLAVPVNSGYYPASAVAAAGGEIRFPIAYTDTCSTATYYIIGNAELRQNSFIGPANGLTTSKCAMVVLGELQLPNGSGSSASGATYNVYVPTEVWKEYQVFDTAAPAQYPADTGFRSWSNTFNVNDQTVDAGRTIFHGLVYVGLDMKAGSGNKKIVGVVVCQGEVIHQSGTLIFYYNKNVDKDIIFSGIKFRRDYWAEFLAGSFDNPNW